MILLTAFVPFGGADVNASQVVAERLAAANTALELLLLPVVAGKAEAILRARLAEGPLPTVCLSLGEADDTPHVRLEKVAVNWDDFRIPDNDGNQPRDSAIREDGPAAYFATVPVSDIARRLTGTTPLPVVVSLTAGAFVCNHLAYAMLDALSENPVCPFLFVHVPKWRPEGSLSLDDLCETVAAVIAAVAEH